jgi:hypothetical protein
VAPAIDVRIQQPDERPDCFSRARPLRSIGSFAITHNAPPV